jgi:hypothetical protein
MNYCIESIRNTRSFLLQLTGGLTTRQLNEVPDGFNNNILWNLGHLVASQQGVCYLRAGLKTWVPENVYLQYKPDTKPSGFLNSAEVAEIKSLLFTSLEQLEKDYHNKLFQNYISWTTRYGVPITTIEEALQFLLFHEGMHTGYLMALKRVVTKQAAPPITP